MANPGNLTDEQMQVLAQRIAAMANTPSDAPAKGVRQYVGARYVPVFANPLEWSDTREYEPLTIVIYQGNSFTSMQSVPTGIDIDNTDYWALTGNYNAQVEAYRKEVLSFNDRIEAVENECVEINTDLLPLTETGKLVYDPNIKSWVGVENTAYRADNGTRFYIIPKGKVETGTGGCLKIFADNYPDAPQYRDFGIYFSADQNNDTGYRNQGVFWINTKNEGYNGNSDIGVCFQDGERPLLKMIDGPYTPFIYVGSKNPVFKEGEIFYKVQIDGNTLIKAPYRLFLGARNSLYENVDTTELNASIYANWNIMIAGEQVLNINSTGLHTNQNIEVTENNLGIILRSPNETRYKICVSDNGQLSTTKLS